MKTIVVYKSKSGYTETYARWIQEELQCDISEAGSVSIETLQSYDTILYGGGLYAVGINGIKLIKDHFPTLQDKNLIVWATGCSPGRPEQLKEVWNHNFSQEQLQHIKTFYLRGGFDYKKLEKGDKVLMSMLKIRLKLMKNKDEDALGMLSSYKVPEYHCDKQLMEPLLQYVKSLSIEK